MADDQDQTTTENNNPNLEQLRKKAEEADRLREELRQRDFRDTFAGLNQENPTTRLLMDAYKPEEGESFSREGLAAVAERYGVKLEDLSMTSEPEPTPTPEPEQTTQGNPTSPYATEPVSDVAAAIGDEGAAAGTPDDLSTGRVGSEVWRRYDAQRKEGKPREEAQVDGLRTIFEAAGQGNQSVLYDQARWRAENTPR